MTCPAPFNMASIESVKKYEGRDMNYSPPPGISRLLFCPAFFLWSLGVVIILSEFAETLGKVFKFFIHKIVDGVLWI